MPTKQSVQKQGKMSWRSSLLMAVSGVFFAGLFAFYLSQQFAAEPLEYGVGLQTQVFSALLILGIVLSVGSIVVMRYFAHKESSSADKPKSLDFASPEFAVMIRAMEGVVIGTDKQGHVLFLNGMAKGIFECEADVIGRHFDTICTLTEERNGGAPNRLRLDSMRKGTATLQTNCQDWQVPVSYTVSFSSDASRLRVVAFQPIREDVPAHLARIFDNALEEIYSVDADTFHLRRLNESACRNLQMTIAEAQLLTLRDIVPELAKESIEDLLGPLRDGVKKELRISLHHRRKDGSVYPVETKIVYGGDETSACFYIYAEDITEREQAHEEIVKSSELLQELKQLANVGTWELDLNSKVFSWSPEIYRIVGIDEHETSPPVTKLLLRVHPEDKHIVDDALFTFDEEDKYQEANYRLVMADGVVKHVSQTSRYIYEQENQSGKLVGTLQDVSEQVGSERNLQLSQRMDAVGQMAGGIAHDFNNLLGIVIGNLDMLGLKVKDERNKKRIDTALSAATRGADLTRKLLNFSRSTPQNVDATDVNTVLEGMTELLNRSVTPAIRVETALESDLWLASIDPSEFENAVLNLVINARDAIGQNPGLIVIETSNCDPREGSKAKSIEPVLVESIEIAVSDNGSGMPPEVADRVFEPFFSTKTSNKGTGLGLAMVYGFVERHNGSIRVESELKSGTTFTIMLPRCEGVLSEQRKTEDSNEIVLARGEERILVVDDELELGMIAGDYLEEAGYTIELAGNAEEALQKLRKSKFDLLFSDIIMPGKLNGVQLAETVKRKYPNTLVLLTSGFTANALESDLMKNYKDLLLPKPYRRDSLLTRVRSVLDGTNDG